MEALPPSPSSALGSLPDDVLRIVIEACAGSLHWRLHSLSRVCKRWRRLTLLTVTSLPRITYFSTWQLERRNLIHLLLPSLTCLDMWPSEITQQSITLPRSLSSLSFTDHAFVMHPCNALCDIVCTSSLTSLRLVSLECPCVARRLSTTPPPLVALHLEDLTAEHTRQISSIILPSLRKLKIALTSACQAAPFEVVLRNHAAQLHQLSILWKTDDSRGDIITGCALENCVKTLRFPRVTRLAYLELCADSILLRALDNNCYPALAELKVYLRVITSEEFEAHPTIHRTLTRVRSMIPTRLLHLPNLTALNGISYTDLAWCTLDASFCTQLRQLVLDDDAPTKDKAALAVLAPFTNLTSIAFRDTALSLLPSFSLPHPGLSLPLLERVRFSKLKFQDADHCVAFWLCILNSSRRLKRACMYLTKQISREALVSLFTAYEAAGVELIEVWSRGNRALVREIAVRLVRLELRCFN